MKLCENCKVEKDFSAFQPNKEIADGYSEVCNACMGYKIEKIDPLEGFAECSKCNRVELPQLEDRAKEYGITQSSFKKHGFAVSVLKWVHAGYKCEVCKKNDHGLSINSEGTVICSGCLKNKTLKDNNEKSKKTV